ncbi:MAG: phosphoribosylglycinamide formyltransferase [Nitrospiraceae bacterium]
MGEQRPHDNLRVGVLASGRGSNLQAIIDAILAGRLRARVTVVISNKKAAEALERARRHGIPDVFVDPKPCAEQSGGREAYDRALLEVLRKHDVELVLLAGYMRIVTSVLISAYPNHILNIHPSLLPAFPGLDAQQKALDWGVKLAGCTVHVVTEGVDEGPIIIQASVPVCEQDTVDSLSERILAEEHRIYPRAVQLYAEGRVRVEGRRVRIAGQSKTAGRALINPE